MRRRQHRIAHDHVAVGDVARHLEVVLDRLQRARIAIEADMAHAGERHEIEDTFRAEVPAVCRAYCTQTWKETLNRAGLEASSELRKSENIYFPPAIRTSNLASTQGEATSIVASSAKEAQPQDPFPPNQQEQLKELEASKDTSSDKVAEVPKDGAASQSFKQALASTTIPAGEAPKEKEKVIPREAADKASENKLQIKLRL